MRSIPHLRFDVASGGRNLQALIRTILRGSKREMALIGSAAGLLIAAGAHAQEVAPGKVESETQSQSLAEITVTAQRRSESVEDVPYNITAIDSSSILESGATSINDLTRLVPGLATVDEGPGARGLTNNLTLRGLRTDIPGGGPLAAEQPGQTVNSVSTYFGETPVFFAIPLYDVDRVEVLRGPQGTLYGSGAQAGTIRLVPTRPKFDEFSGEVQATEGFIENATTLGNSNRDIKGIVNVPLMDHLAVRVVAGTEFDGGFINNVDLVERRGSGVTAVPIPSIPGDLDSGPVIGPEERNTNTTHQWFARGAIRWQPADMLDFQVDYLHQYINSANSQLSNPGFPGGLFDLTTPSVSPPSPTNPAHWPNSTFLLQPGGTYTSTQFALTPDETKTDLVSAVATVDFGLATLTSASSYYDVRSLGTTDWAPQFDVPNGVNFNLYSPYNFYPRMLPVASVPANDHSFIQEVRLVSAGSHRFDYVVGAYYQREVTENGWQQYVPGIYDYEASIGMPNPTNFGDLTWNYHRSWLFQDRAVFGELTAHVTPAWQITGGVRFFRQTFGIDSSSYFYLCGAACASDGISPDGGTLLKSATSFSNHVWKLNSSYDITGHLKVYATFSEGFRRGGANDLPTVGPFASLPNYGTYSPDFAKNYEIGVKGSLLERRIVYTADIYRIDLNNFQFNAVDLSGIPATYNGNTARSQGAELELQMLIGTNTNITLGYTYTDAKVTQTVSLFDFPAYGLPAFGGTGQTAPLFGGPIPSGSRLPGVPDNTLTFAVDYFVPLNRSPWRRLTLHLDGAYRDSEEAAIQATSPYNWVIPWSFVGNARATIDAGDHFSFGPFVHNFTNDPGYSGGNNPQTFPNYARWRDVTEPRTYGLTARYHW